MSAGHCTNEVEPRSVRDVVGLIPRPSGAGILICYDFVMAIATFRNDAEVVDKRGPYLLPNAHPVKNDSSKVRAGCLNGAPIMPAWIEILVLAQLGFFQVVRHGIGQLNLQLLQG